MADKDTKAWRRSALSCRLTQECLPFVSQKLIDETAAEDLPLSLNHTRCPRCRVWSRRPERCPHCGAAKAGTVQERGE
jgi:hypothetical protein